MPVMPSSVKTRTMRRPPMPTKDWSSWWKKGRSWLIWMSVIFIVCLSWCVWGWISCLPVCQGYEGRVALSNCFARFSAKGGR